MVPHRHDAAALQRLRELCKIRQQDARQRVGLATAGTTELDDRRPPSHACGYQCPEIGVGGHDDTIVGCCPLEDLDVLRVLQAERADMTAS